MDYKNTLEKNEIRVECEKCQAIQTVKPVAKKEMLNKRVVNVVTITCKNCGEEHVAHVADYKGESLRKQVVKLKAKLVEVQREMHDHTDNLVEEYRIEKEVDRIVAEKNREKNS